MSASHGLAKPSCFCDRRSPRSPFRWHGANAVFRSAQRVEQPLRRLPVGLHAEPFLDGRYRRLRAGAAIAVALAVIIATLLALGLPFDLLDDFARSLRTRPPL